MVDISQVDFSRYDGGGDIDRWIADACAAAAVPADPYWSKGLHELCKRESSFDPNAVNTTDSNATGPIVGDGHPLNCSRGLAQCIPETFARYRVASISWQIYDPVANIAAAIGYIRARYAVRADGADLVAKVQQADPTRPPRGYLVVNQDHFCTCPTNSAHGQRAAIPEASKWSPNQDITIRFLDGDPALCERVKAVAREWTQEANLNFIFVEAGAADVRIAFTPGAGSWSFVGQDCTGVPEPQPTMNYGWLTVNSDETEVRRVVLHEFGHMIGLIHEHLNPKGGIHWNKEAVYHDLEGPPNNWDQPTVDENMFKFYPETALIATAFDPLSIMIYPIPRAWTTDGFSAGTNTEISVQDKALVSSVYSR